MIKNDYIIRVEKAEDYKETENLVRDAFWNQFKAGCVEHFVLNQLRDDEAFIPQLDFVMEKDGQIIGQIIFVKADIVKDDGSVLPAATFGPVCIKPQYQRQGYGKALVDFALEKRSEMGIAAVLIAGNIRFYSHCGFTYAREYGIRYHGLPQGASDSFFLCKELKKGYLENMAGEYSTPEGYFVADHKPEEFASFERQFLNSQIKSREFLLSAFILLKLSESYPQKIPLKSHPEVF